jgi:hypothetical protein
MKAAASCFYCLDDCTAEDFCSTNRTTTTINPTTTLYNSPPCNPSRLWSMDSADLAVGAFEKNTAAQRSTVNGSGRNE